MYRYRCIFLICFIFSSGFSFANESGEICIRKKIGHRFLIGPETYYAYRHREGGTKQDGSLFGGRCVYEYLRRNKFYWAAEGALAQGTLTGKSGNRGKLKSTLCDRSIETRFGYTFRYKRACKLILTPFFGVGYLIEENNFKNPSSLHLHFKTAYRFLTAGFLSNLSIGKHLTAGFNIKIRHMLDPECKISNDPEFDTISLKIENDSLQYRLEFPVTYLHHYCSFVATPFYERRCYGRQAGYPFDFLKTTLFNYGLTLQVLFSL
ncbi:MAG: hypothetical protein H0T62_11885 [Parachlamydiaceae bacterium]|nr:hypothetical protein [Parachlamydiaceae bacterium]